MDTVNELIGMKIRFLRIKKGLTQEQLAELADTSGAYIGYIERGERTPSLKTAVNVADALGVTADDLLGDSLKNTNIIEIMKDFYPILDCTKEEASLIIKVMNALRNILRDYRIT